MTDHEIQPSTGPGRKPFHGPRQAAAQAPITLAVAA